MPITHKDEDMPKWGWKKSIRYERLRCDENTKSQIVLEELDFYVENLRCGTCKTNIYSWITIPPHHYSGGVFIGCSKCGRVSGPMGDEYALAPQRRIITVEEAKAIVDRTKQGIPKMLQEMFDNMDNINVLTKRNLPTPPRVGE